MASAHWIHLLSVPLLLVSLDQSRLQVLNWCLVGCFLLVARVYNHRSYNIGYPLFAAAYHLLSLCV